MEYAVNTKSQSEELALRLLSACYYQPEAHLLEEDVFGQLEAALDIHSERLAGLAAQLKEAFCAAGVDALLLDYTRLFLGPYEIYAKPYGSVYLEGEKVVMGDSTMQAVAYYREAEFSVADDFREMPDHIAVELEFLYLLYFKENQATAEGQNEIQAELSDLKARFLRDHLGRWIGPFCERVREHAQTDFYRKLADMTEGCILHLVNKSQVEV